MTNCQEATKRHKWADVIIAWANGEVIQSKSHKNDRWRDVPTKFDSTPCFCTSDSQWRIKPKEAWIAIHKNGTVHPNTFPDAEAAAEMGHDFDIYRIER